MSSYESSQGYGQGYNQKKQASLPLSSARELPHDLLAERSLLGCLLLDGQIFDDIIELQLGYDDFFNPQYAIVYGALLDLFTQQRPIDYVTVCSHLNAQGKLEDLGGEVFISGLSEDQASSANAFFYAQIVKEKSRLRVIIRTAMRVAQRGLEFTGPSHEYISEVEAQFFQLTNDAKSSQMTRLVGCLKENMKALDRNSPEYQNSEGIPSGYFELDKLLVGLQAGQLVIVAARPAMGKSAFAMNLAVNCAERTGKGVAVFNLEMTKTELSLRLISMKSRIDSKNFKTKNLTPENMFHVSHAVNELSRLPIFINDATGISVPEIQSMCRKIMAQEGLGMIVIDYLQLLKPHSNTPSREQQIAEMSRALKGMAKELKCPVIALSQLNRSVEGQQEKRPNLSDLRESGSIEQDADVVMMIYRDEYYYPDSTKKPGIAEILVRKNRAGETGTAELIFVGAYTSFENKAFDGQAQLPNNNNNFKKK